MGLLRTLLALSVVTVHSGAIFGYKGVGGIIAVQIFYMISGFYMALILSEKYFTATPGTEQAKNRYSLFISNRLLRLFPVYWAVLVATLILKNDLGFFFRTWPGFNSFSEAFVKFANLGILGQDLIMFLGINTQNGNLFFTPDFSNTEPKLFSFLLLPQAWTLSLEIVFYLIAPFLMNFKLRWIFLIMAASFVLKILIRNIGWYHDPWIYRFFPCELFFFLSGRFTYELYKKLRNVRIPRSALLLVAAFVFGTTLLFPYFQSVRAERLYFILMFFSLPFVFLCSQKSKTDAWIGELSYPIYIVHIFAALCLDHLGPESFFNTQTTLTRGTVVGLMSICMAIVIKTSISDPIDRFRQRRISF